MNELNSKLQSGVKKLCDAVKVTLGPKGGNVILFDERGIPYLTKDGVSVANKVTSSDLTEFAAINIMREGTSKTAQLAGDGTTTSTVIASYIFNAGLKAISENRVHPNTLKNQMYAALDGIIDSLKRQSKPISINKNHLSYIATTSANNDSEIGNLVAEAFMQSGSNGTVIFEMSDSKTTSIETIKGSQFLLNYYNSDFVTDEKKGQAVYDDPVVLLYNGDLTTMAPVVNILKEAMTENKPVVIFAHNFSEKLIRLFHINNVQKVSRVLPIKITGYTDSKKDTMMDLAAVCGIEDFNTTMTLSKGTCSKIVCSVTDTIIVPCEGPEFNKIFNHRADVLKAQINEYPGVKELERQYARFLGRVSVIKVGGNTEVEAHERYDRVEDAVCATYAALAEGISAGGGSTYMTIRDYMPEDKDNVGYTILRDALSAPFNQLCENSGLDPNAIWGKCKVQCLGYNFLTDKVCDLKIEGVVDPTKVLRTALENAVSVASILLTTAWIVKPESL